MLNDPAAARRRVDRAVPSAEGQDVPGCSGRVCRANDAFQHECREGGIRRINVLVIRKPEQFPVARLNQPAPIVYLRVGREGDREKHRGE